MDVRTHTHLIIERVLALTGNMLVICSNAGQTEKSTTTPMFEIYRACIITFAFSKRVQCTVEERLEVLWGSENSPEVVSVCASCT